MVARIISTFCRSIHGAKDNPITNIITEVLCIQGKFHLRRVRTIVSNRGVDAASPPVFSDFSPCDGSCGNFLLPDEQIEMIRELMSPDKV